MAWATEALMTTWETSDCSWWPDGIAERAYSYCCAVWNTISSFLSTGLAEVLVAFISRANWFLCEWGKATHGVDTYAKICFNAVFKKFDMHPLVIYFSFYFLNGG